VRGVARERLAAARVHGYNVRVEVEQQPPRPHRLTYRKPARNRGRGGGRGGAHTPVVAEVGVDHGACGGQQRGVPHLGCMGLQPGCMELQPAAWGCSLGCMRRCSPGAWGCSLRRMGLQRGARTSRSVTSSTHSSSTRSLASLRKLKEVPSWRPLRHGGAAVPHGGGGGVARPRRRGGGQAGRGGSRSVHSFAQLASIHSGFR